MASPEEDAGLPWWVDCLFHLVVVMLVYWIGVGYGHNAERRRAIEAGVGRWAIDPRTSVVTFEYGPDVQKDGGK